MFQKSKKGFTLIELMVVIAIIAILATVVLVALQGARDAAQDSKRKSALSQVRSVAEVHYATSGQSYATLADETDGVYVNSEIGQLMNEHGDAENGNLTIHSDADNYCAVIELTGHHVTENYRTFCVGNADAPGERDSAGCAAGNIACE